MALTTAQRTILAAAIRADADPEVVAALATRNDTELTRLYNLPTDYIIWKTYVSQDEIMQNGFDWVRVDNLSVGKARIWEWLFDNEQSGINPSKPNVRSGIAECWKGTAADLAVQAAVLAHCRRPATKAEKVFASGTGTDADPALSAWTGSIDTEDVGRALNDN